MKDRLRTRVRVVLDDWFGFAVVALLALALLGGWGIYTTHVAPGTHTETVTATSWESTGGYDHQATVTESNPVYRTGTTLSNQSVYFSSISPILNGTFTYTYTASESGQLQANVTLEILVRSVDQGEESRTEYWQVPLRTREKQMTLAPGQSLRVRFSQNVSAAKQLMDQIEQRLGGSPGTKQVIVRSRVHLSGTVNGNSVSRIQTFSLPIEIDGKTYRVQAAGPVTNSEKETRAVRKPNEYGPLHSIGGPVLLVASLATLAGLGRARQQGRLRVEANEREALTYADEREEFDEWISTASLPDSALDGPQADVESLEGLVDLAIDTDRRVIEDTNHDCYVVRADGIVYVYEPPLFHSRLRG